MANKFRLKMAAQLGEKVASEAGFTKFPISPLQITEDNKIAVEAKPADVKGVSGALIFAGSDVTLIYSTEYNQGFQNFSIAHELGHYFIPGHPEEIMRQGGSHLSRANFTENSSIELEADHFASGLLLPATLTRKFLSSNQMGLDGILRLAEKAECSRTAAAIRSAECAPYPVAIVVSQVDKVAYAFLSDSFKALGKLAFLKKGTPLPQSATRQFNIDPENVRDSKRACDETDLGTWFEGPASVRLDEEVIGLGRYGFTLTILSSEELPDDPNEDEDDDAELQRSWSPKFAYGR